MSGNALKTPFVYSQNKHAIRKIENALAMEGQQLPVSVVAVNNAIVTVSFLITRSPPLPNVTIPQAMSIYSRPPTQADDLGIVVSADTYIGGISGLGGGIASMVQRANLAALVYLPVSSEEWAAVRAGTYNIWGPQGVDLSDNTTGSTISLRPNSITITNHDSVQIASGTNQVTVTPTGITMTLPTSPGATGTLWNDLGTVKVA